MICTLNTVSSRREKRKYHKEEKTQKFKRNLLRDYSRNKHKINPVTRTQDKFITYGLLINSLNVCSQVE